MSQHKGTRSKRNGSMHALRVIAAGMLVPLLAAVLAVAPATPATAATTTATLKYTGSNNQDKPIVDTGLLYLNGCKDENGHYGFQDPATTTVDPATCPDDNFPGQTWFSIEAGIRNTVVTAQSANFSVTNPDDMAQGESANFTHSLAPVNLDGTEFVVRSEPYIRLVLAYDEPGSDCPANSLTTEEQLRSATTDGCLAIVFDSGTMELSSLTLLEKDGMLPMSGDSAFSQNIDKSILDVAKLAGLDEWGVTAQLKLRLSTVLSLLATKGFRATRSLATSSDSTPFHTMPVHWTDSTPRDDFVTIPCMLSPGDNIVYQLEDNTWGGSGTVTSQLKLLMHVAGPFFDQELDIVESPSVDLFDSDVNARAGDYTKAVGTVAPDRTPPVIAAISHVGDTVEGAEVAFSGIVTDNCPGEVTYEWRFSDGGIGFGPTTHHRFQDNGVYTGVLTATDKSGNASSRNFSVDIDNADPSVTPPPHATAAWGVPIDFHAQVYDAGEADRSTLQVLWDFGDGTGAAGSSARKAYAGPGAYAIGLTVADKDGAIGTAWTSALITKRATTTGMLGDHNATHDSTATYAASVTDAFGNPVQGRNIEFTTVGSPDLISATTDTAGVAKRDQTVTAPAGDYTVAAAFAGDHLYEPSSSTSDMRVLTKETITTYSGPASSKPSRTVTLTASLADADGKPLAGRTVVFELGNQSATAVTDSSGLAAAAVKLRQKPGNYPLTVTYDPAGSDIGRYEASRSSTTFHIG